VLKKLKSKPDGEPMVWKVVIKSPKTVFLDASLNLTIENVKKRYPLAKKIMEQTLVRRDTNNSCLEVHLNDSEIHRVCSCE